MKPPRSAPIRPPEPYKGKGHQVRGRCASCARPAKSGKEMRKASLPYLLVRHVPPSTAHTEPRSVTSRLRRHLNGSAATAAALLCFRSNNPLRPGHRRRGPADTLGCRLDPRQDLRASLEVSVVAMFHCPWGSWCPAGPSGQGHPAVVFDRGGKLYHGRGQGPCPDAAEKRAPCSERGSIHERNQTKQVQSGEIQDPPPVQQRPKASRSAAVAAAAGGGRCQVGVTDRGGGTSGRTTGVGQKRELRMAGAGCPDPGPRSQNRQRR